MKCFCRRRRQLPLVDRINAYTSRPIVPIYSVTTGEVIGWMRAS